MASTHKTLRIPEATMKQLRARVDESTGVNLSESLRRQLNRYFSLLTSARLRLQNQFTAEELTNLCQLGNGTMFGDTSEFEIGLRANAEDALPEEVPYPNALPSLRKKLNNLERIEHAALVDAVERYWSRTGAGKQTDPARILE